MAGNRDAASFLVFVLDFLFDRFTVLCPFVLDYTNARQSASFIVRHGGRRQFYWGRVWNRVSAAFV